MALHRLEVYVDSYRNKPFIKDFKDGIRLSPGDEQQLEDWIGLLSGRKIALERHLKIEDVKHHLLETMDSIVRATSVRVSIVD